MCRNMFAFALGLLAIAKGSELCECNTSGVVCSYDCSDTFCLCDENGYGSKMITASGTLCRNGEQVWSNDCIDSTVLPVYTPLIQQSSSCNCSTIGVNCLQKCSSQFCLCGTSANGSLLSAANGTVCLDGYIISSDDQQCLPESQTAVCKDGLYCTAQCSITYYYCSNGLRYPDMFVPSGTLCANKSMLIHPDQCEANTQTLVQSCDTITLTFQCFQSCSPLFYYCLNYTVFALQTAPRGLVCYDNSFVLASHPVCTKASLSYYPFPLSISYNNSERWSILSDYELTAAFSSAFTSAGVHVLPNDMYIVSNSNQGRQLVVTTDCVLYAKEQVKSVFSNAVQTYLPNELRKRNIAIEITPLAFDSYSATPSQSATAIANQFPYVFVSSAPNNTNIYIAIMLIMITMIYTY